MSTTMAEHPLPPASHARPPEAGTRIAKVIAASGYASRRYAEQLIVQKRVRCEGEIVEHAAYHVLPGQSITIDGSPLPVRSDTPRLWRYHKPRAVLVSTHDPQGRRTIYDALPPALQAEQVLPVGRLDYASEGLLLLTNHKPWIHLLTHPRFGYQRVYHVCISGTLPANAKQRLSQGFGHDSVQYAPITLHEKPPYPTPAHHPTRWITLTLSEGKNREIRRILEAFGTQVERLQRVRYGPFQLGKLPVGGAALVEQDALPTPLLRP